MIDTTTGSPRPPLRMMAPSGAPIRKKIMIDTGSDIFLCHSTLLRYSWLSASLAADSSNENMLRELLASVRAWFHIRALSRSLSAERESIASRLPKPLLSLRRLSGCGSTELSRENICSLSSGSYERVVALFTRISSESISCCSSLMFLVWLFENWLASLRCMAKPSMGIV